MTPGRFWRARKCSESVRNAPNPPESDRNQQNPRTALSTWLKAPRPPWTTCFEVWIWGGGDGVEYILRIAPAPVSSPKWAPGRGCYPNEIWLDLARSKRAFRFVVGVSWGTLSSDVGFQRWELAIGVHRGYQIASVSSLEGGRWLGGGDFPGALYRLSPPLYLALMWSLGRHLGTLLWLLPPMRECYPNDSWSYLCTFLDTWWSYVFPYHFWDRLRLVSYHVRDIFENGVLYGGSEGGYHPIGFTLNSIARNSRCGAGGGGSRAPPQHWSILTPGLERPVHEQSGRAR